MIRKIAGLQTNNRCLLVSTLILLLGVSGCNLLKNLLNKGDTGADAQASAAPSVSVAAPPTAAIAPEIPSAMQPSATPNPIGVVTVAKPKPSGSAAASAAPVASGTAPAAASAVASAAPVASAAAPALPVINPECQAACQKSFQDCMTQKTGVAPLELVRQCRAALAPCVTTCSK